jgi:hypothetical protein
MHYYCVCDEPCRRLCFIFCKSRFFNCLSPESTDRTDDGWLATVRAWGSTTSLRLLKAAQDHNPALRIAIRAALSERSRRVAAGRGALILQGQGLDPADYTISELVRECMRVLGTAAALSHGNALSSGKKRALESGMAAEDWD